MNVFIMHRKGEIIMKAKANVTLFIFSLIAISILIVVPVPDAKAENTVEKLLVGDVKVEMIQSYSGKTLPKPNGIVVYDFKVPDGVVTMDNSAAARVLGHGVVSRLTGDTTTDTSLAAVEQNVEASFSKALVSELEKTSIPTEKGVNANAKYPAGTILVRGDFTTVDQGNKSKRILIGFGRGASDVKAHVTVLLTTTGAEPIVLEEFNLKSESGKKPGAGATMGIGSAAMAGVSVATGSAGDKKATVGADASRMAKAVAKQVDQVMVSQQWIPAPQSKAVQQAQAE